MKHLDVATAFKFNFYYIVYNIERKIEIINPPIDIFYIRLRSKMKK